MTQAQSTFPIPAQFSTLKGGDLFLYFYPEKQPCFCIVASPEQKFVAPFSAPLGRNDCGPTMSIAQSKAWGQNEAMVISFGKNYSLRLPCGDKGWSDSSPTKGTPCILVSQDGKKYLRVSAMNAEMDLPPQYVDTDTGNILASDSTVLRELATNSGVFAFALEWEVFTNEEKPRLIFKQSVLNGSTSRAG